VVLDGDHGFPYGSFRGGWGVQITRPDGWAVMGYDAKPDTRLLPRFVQAHGSHFRLNGEVFYYVGANTWDLMDTARYFWERPKVDQRLDEMKSYGLTVGRTWGFSLGTGTHVEGRRQRLQLRPGVYDEDVFLGMDYTLHKAAERGIRLIICLEDYWLSVDRYIEWSPTAGSKTDFYTDWHCREQYKAHVRAFVNRVNTITGIPYREDPTIFAWNLMNEPRCTGCGWALQAWVEEMSLFMKAVDPYHMVTIGEEGFYSRTCERVFMNPGAGSRRTGIASSPWALMEGQDFLENHRPASIDFATVHAWPDNWMGFADYSPWMSNKAFDYAHGNEVWREKLDYLERWIQAHIEDSARLGKPLIVEEFGKAIPADKLYENNAAGLLDGEWVQSGLHIRNEFFKAVYRLIESSARAGGPAMGSNFWVFYRRDQGWDDPYSVTIDDTSTFQVIKDSEWNMRMIAQSNPNPAPTSQQWHSRVADVAETN